jgi:hypothetical protein
VVPMRQLSGCKSGPCPKVFETDSGDFEVQGTTVSGNPLTTVPAHESLVRIPRSVMLEAIRLLKGKA